MAANKCSFASVSPNCGHTSRDQVMSLASAVAHLNAVSAGVSVEPADYNWGTPSLVQQQALYAQFIQLAFMAALPQMQYTHLSAGLQAGRGGMFSGFVPPFSSFLPPVAAPCPVQSPSAAPCSVSAQGQQVVQPGSGHPENGVKVGKATSPSKKLGAGAKAKGAKSQPAVPNAPSATVAGGVKNDPDIELEDICRLLGDDAFLEHLQDDVLSEGSNGSSSTSDGRVLSKNNSNDCLSGSLNNNDGGLFSDNNFATAFDIDMDDLPAAAPVREAPAAPKPPVQLPSKACSGDLNNMVASSPTKSTRSSRLAAREAAAAAAKDAAGTGGSGGPVTKVTLKTNKGGVHKASGSKPSKVHAAAAADAVAAAAAAGASASGRSVAAAPHEQAMATQDCPLTAADLSRLLGEDDNRIPEGWDLDLDFENPFSCSISAF